MKKCTFCNIIEKNDNNIIYQDSNIIVLPDINPKAPIHLLIIPKKHIINIKYLTFKTSSKGYKCAQIKFVIVHSNVI